MEKIWLKHYPEGVPADLPPYSMKTIADLFFESCQRYKDQVAFTNFDSDLTFEDLFFLSNDFASFLQQQGLQKGDRIALQLANVLQYPVALFGALRAGLVVVNTNPLYTPTEMKHQFRDSGAKAIVILANAAHHLEKIIAETEIKIVVVTEIGDLLGWPKSWVINGTLRYIKKMVPGYNLPGHVSFYEALDQGAERSFNPPQLTGDDLAFLQYTGGTTGVAKGAMLTHHNVLSNCVQIFEWMRPLLEEGKEVVAGALPLYHIFALTLNCLSFLYYGGRNVLITNPRDIPGLVKAFRKYQFTAFPGLNTLFNALLNNADFQKLDLSHLKISVAGGMALQNAVAQRWKEITKSMIVEGYGLTETSPVVSCNPIDGTERVGTIGLPLPGTDIQLIADDGKVITQPNEPGELCVRGPQVMKGYWHRPDETAKVFLKDGWLKTGDMACVDEDGFLKIVDRKKDMILVSGFNVYPNEVEDVVAMNPKVLEVAAVGIPDAHSGEVVKIFVVRRDESLTEQELKDFCKQHLTHYKLPKVVEFRKELPKTNVGKILRRELRDSSAPRPEAKQA